MTHRRCAMWLALTALTGVVMVDSTVRAHKPITSKFTYNTDLFPLFRDRCSACHSPTGPGPMSLLTHKEAYPWAQSIMEEVVNLRMPPRYAEPGVGELRNGHALTAREIDTIVDWTTGGAPEGDRDKKPQALTPLTGWSLGEPDGIFVTPEYTLSETISEETRWFAIPTTFGRDRWIQAIDILPGNRTIVRSVTLYIDTSGNARARDRRDSMSGFSEENAGSGFSADQILAVWLPGETLTALSDDVAFRLPAKSTLVLRVRYGKTWTQEGERLSDRTSVGLYLADRPPARVVQPVVIAGQGILPTDVEVLAMLPSVGPLTASYQVDVVRPDGSREPLLLLSRPNPHWQSRYWLKAPLFLPKGTRIDVRTTLDTSTEPANPAGAKNRTWLRLDTVRRRPRTED